MCFCCVSMDIECHPTVEHKVGADTTPKLSDGAACRIDFRGHEESPTPLIYALWDLEEAVPYLIPKVVILLANLLTLLNLAVVELPSSSFHTPLCPNQIFLHRVSWPLPQEYWTLQGITRHLLRTRGYEFLHSASLCP